jgi:hypothetical protein
LARKLFTPRAKADAFLRSANLRAIRLAKLGNKIIFARAEPAIDWRGWRVKGGLNGARESGVAEDLIGYDQLMQDAMRNVVRNALQSAQGSRGLPGKHHFYITFRTHFPGVVIPDHLTQRYPDEMTIVLEHQFWDLEVFPDYFRVILKFSGQPQPIVIPFAALTRFFDPSVKFGLQFEQPALDEPRMAASEGGVSAPPPAAAAPAAAEATNGAVVSLDAFRKK